MYVQSLKILKIGVPWAFMLVLFLCKRGTWHQFEMAFCENLHFWDLCALHMNLKMFGWELLPTIGAIVIEYFF